MRKRVLLAACLLLGAAVSGCAPRPEMKPEATIVFVNEAEEADVWFVPDTEQNRRTTVWGTATVAKLGANETCEVLLDALGGAGTYLIRMIGTNGMYYAVDGVALADGYTVRLRLMEDLSVVAEVTDAAGASVGTYTGFAARL